MTTTDGRSSRAAAIRCAGVVLSHEDSNTIPSSTAPSTATSTSLTIRSRVGMRYRPLRPAEVTKSLGAAVRISNGRPPAPRIAAATRFATLSRWMKHTDKVDEVLTTAILGFSWSAREIPIADHCALRTAQRVVPGVKLLRRGATARTYRLIVALEQRPVLQPSTSCHADPAGSNGTPAPAFATLRRLRYVTSLRHLRYVNFRGPVSGRGPGAAIVPVACSTVMP